MSNISYAELKNGTFSIDQVFAIFDDIGSVDVAEISGSWSGAEVNTRHEMQGLLEAIDWVGKVFEDDGNAHPLVLGRKKRFAIKPFRPLLRLALAVPLFRKPFMAPINSLIARCIQTKKTQATLRMINFRGVVSAAMVYDDVPITDFLRKIDDDHLLGIMEFKWVDEPYAFLLKRD